MRAGTRAALLVVTALLVVAVARFVAAPHDEAVRGSRVCAECVTTTPPPTAVVAGPYGQWLVDAAGNVEAFGDAPVEGSRPSAGPVVAIAATPTGRGYWTVTRDGAVHASGDARHFGDPSALASTGAIAAIAPTPDGAGYWLATRDGAVLPFGNAAHVGDRAGPGDDAVVAMVASPSGRGYRLATEAGHVYAFGDARDAGDAPGEHIVGMAATPSGKGYWLVSASGGVFSFGDARFAGAAVGTGGRAVGIAATATGGGYWLGFDSGEVRWFGDAQPLGPRTGGHRTGPAVAMASTSRELRYRVPRPGDVEFDGRPAAMKVAYLTSEQNARYDARFVGDVFRVSTSEGGDGRMLFWPATVPAAGDVEVRSTWRSEAGDLSQPGHAHRVTYDADGLHAVTITRNVWLRTGWIVNVHAWRHAEPHLVAQIALPRLRDRPLPWRVATRVAASVVMLKVWPAVAAEPAWGDPQWGATVFLPDWYGVAASGRNGWYAGHLLSAAGAGAAAIDFADLRIRTLS